MISESQPTAPSKIHRLDETLINQIAAGEVVERPASVVKELVENSLDAGSTTISVGLKDGGIAEISVIDDGFGMSTADLLLSVERHTTSKLKQPSDLEHLETFGFRGEALSSIASVSELEIRTHLMGDPKGHVLKCSFGQLSPSISPIGMPTGTAIYVRELFKKIPARQKFLRSVATEFSHCAAILKEIALANPEVTLELSHQGKLVYKYYPQSREARVRDVLKWNWSPLQVKDHQEDITLECFLSPGHLIRDRTELYLIVNGRSVRHRLIFSAVREAYKNTLGPHHQPTGVIYLEVAAGGVDVNVHPQKMEVRLYKQERLFGWLTALIRKAIGAQPSITEWKPSEEVSEQTTPYFYHTPKLPRKFSPTRDIEPEISPAPMATSRAPEPLPQTFPNLTPSQTTQTSAQLKYLGQAKSSYLICEDKEGIILFDQHALHEKLEFEKLKRAFDSGPLEVQRLLVPLILPLTPDRMAAATENLDCLAKAGFEIEPFGKGDLAVKTRPILVPEHKVEATFLETLDRLSRLGSEAKLLENVVRPVLATIACHSVVTANEILSPAKAQALIAELPTLEEGWTCPHGRPVLFRVTFHSIRKHFERL